MSLMSVHERRVTSLLQPEIFEHLSSWELLEHARCLGSINSDALMLTLYPYRELPSHDPVTRIIAYHRLINPIDTDVTSFADALETKEAVDINTSYDLGVVFAGSLLRRYPPPAGIPPVAAFDGDISGRELIETYLHESRSRTAKKRVIHNKDFNDGLNMALDIFVGHIKEIQPDLMRHGANEVRRGCYDYLSVVALLEAKQSERPNLVRQFLCSAGVRRWLHKRQPT